MRTETISKSRALELLQQSLDKIPELQRLPPASNEFARWCRQTSTAIERIFASKPQQLSDFKGISFSPPPVLFAVAGPNVRQRPKEDAGPYYQRGLNGATIVLQSMIDEIDTFWPDESEPYSFDFWPLIHPEIALVAKPRFESGQYADCAEAALKHLNAIIKEEVRNRTGQEYDGASLMKKAFSVNNPIFTIDTLLTETGKNIQQGYMEIFAGSMTGIRNPKAHVNIKIGRERAIHFIFLASLLMDTYDMANKNYRYGN